MNPWFRNFTPISPWGWAVYVLALAVLVWDYQVIYQTSRSGADIFFNFFPHVAGVFLLAALIIRAKRVKNEE